MSAITCSNTIQSGSAGASSLVRRSNGKLGGQIQLRCYRAVGWWEEVAGSTWLTAPTKFKKNTRDNCQRNDDPEQKITGYSYTFRLGQKMWTFPMLDGPHHYSQSLTSKEPSGTCEQGASFWPLYQSTLYAIL
jgi:hypothetical protein